VGYTAGVGSPEEFYSLLYLGLYNEAKGRGDPSALSGADVPGSTNAMNQEHVGDVRSVVVDEEADASDAKARAYITAASRSAYGLRSNDYMWALSKTHLLQRGWH